MGGNKKNKKKKGKGKSRGWRCHHLKLCLRKMYNLSWDILFDVKDVDISG
jgi:hypothetical protein